MKTNIFPAIKLTVLTLILFSGVYTAVIWGVAQLAPNGGKGEVLTVNGRKYYTNIGQTFTEDKYFYSRPSAVGYNAAGSGGSNKGPSNPDYLAAVQARIDTFRVHNPEIERKDIPVELVTASGSGLDPDISPKAALVQVKRIASIRKISEQTLRQLVAENTQGPLLGMLGPEKVNVLKLNIALDGLK
ncbi:Potassium-transporting ATPase KdpC subunit [Dyadobacter sp. CECT 9275]|uniref:Potassium-transporting ATPase KdpC subunit n=1 Tax=Dyadobacter helix TaxID=2822344 RepID=A0A916NAT4_9BACT|nr:K(+)-transporting ATPase subunit C [Dyadobacter sp. CECT 9275]CAG4992632.1 Potassium-transporting ATPase KdpC subunit [Dyadobacter sp. CECT 9275]